MQGFLSALEWLPTPLREVLLDLPDKQKKTAQEIRLRAGQPVCITAGGAAYSVGMICREAWVQQCFDVICEYSVYAHQEELRRGFITAPNGCRVGVAGTAVLQEGRVVSFCPVTALCIRIARCHKGCSRAIAEHIIHENRVEGLLLCGEPSCGKTSLLRDLSREFSRRGICAAVIDERGELSQQGGGVGCDVLRYVPKAIGVEQAVRCLSPQVVLLDELGDGAEITAVMEGVYRGVPTVASVHCRREEELLHRPALRQALENGGFTRLCFLKGREHPGEIARCIKTEDWLYEMAGNGVGGAVWWGNRLAAIPAPTTACCHLEAVR